jgi:hypothetical protein
LPRASKLGFGRIEAKLSCSNLVLFALDGLAMNLEKGYQPAGDFIIEDADYQPAGIPSLCSRFVRPSIVTGPSLNW